MHRDGVNNSQIQDMRRHFIFALFISFLAIKCFNNVVQAEDEIRIPILVGQTGASATFGKNETDAYTLAAEEWNLRGGVNGRKVVLDFDDTQTSAKQIVTAYQRFATKQPPVILGPTWLDGFPAIIPIAQRDQTLLVTPSAAIEAFSEADSKWPVTFFHNSTLEIEVLIDGLKSRGLEKIALIYEQEPFAEMIRKLVLATHPELVADIGVQAGNADFHANLVRLKTQTPDVLIIFIWDERSLLSLLQQIRLHLPDMMLATVHDGAGWLSNPTFSKVLPQLIYSDFVLSDKTFATRFKTRFGYDPILTASNAYDALNSLLTAMQAGAKSATEIRNFLMTKELNTVTFGRFKFAADGSVPSKVEVIEYKQGKN